MHVLPSGSQGGIALLATQLAEAVGAPLLVASLPELDAAARARSAGEAWHLHFSDRMWGEEPAVAARRLARWAARGPLTVTLHDVPQAWSPPARRRAYVDVARSVTGWVANSHHEVRLLADAATDTGRAGDLGLGHVVPLPVIPLPEPPTAPYAEGSSTVTLGVLGWIYPDKGHREVIRAAGRLQAAGRAVRVTCLGSPVDGHDDLLRELTRRADRAGVELSVTGYVEADRLAEAMREVDVPIAAHHHLSASGSINSWLAAGRRPLVADGRYARELAALRPGTVLLYDAHDRDGHGLDRAVDAALAERWATWLPEHVDVAPRLGDTVAAYRAWWAVTSYAGPHPARPVAPSW